MSLLSGAVARLFVNVTLRSPDSGHGRLSFQRLSEGRLLQKVSFQANPGRLFCQSRRRPLNLSPNPLRQTFSLVRPSGTSSILRPPAKVSPDISAAADVVAAHERATADVTFEPGKQPPKQEHEGGDTDLKHADVIIDLKWGAPSNDVADVITGSFAGDGLPARAEGPFEQRCNRGDGELASEADAHPP